MSGFSASIAAGQSGAPTSAGALQVFLAAPYEPGYSAALDQWHVKTRSAHAVSYSAGAASVTIAELTDKTWIVISGETCASAVRPPASPSTTTFHYLDDGVHVMPPRIRQRAAALLAEWAGWDAQPTSTRVAPVPEYYQVSIVRITGGNFRLVERLMSQVARIMTINNLDTITPDAIEAAREVLVVGV